MNRKSCVVPLKSLCFSLWKAVLCALFFLYLASILLLRLQLTELILHILRKYSFASCHH